MKLSKRLEAIIGMASQWASCHGDGLSMADVGTDHGFVPICLVERDIVKRALAMDIGEGPLLRAREHVRKRGLEDRIQLRISDGLERLSPKEADLVVIAGMGGELMLKILKNGNHVRQSVKGWIFSPQSELSAFRRGLRELGLAIQDEVMVEEDGKYYVVMTAEKGDMEEDYCYRYGEVLIRKKDPVLGKFLERELRQLFMIRKKLLDCGTETAKRRLDQIEKEIQEAEAARERLERDNTKTRQRRF